MHKLVVAGTAFAAVAIVALLAGEVRTQDDRLAASLADRVGRVVQLEVEGVISGFFTEVSGIGSEHEVIEHKVVGPDGKEIVRKIPGRLKWGDITLKRGVFSNLDVWAWRKLVEDGKVEEARRNGTITMLDSTLEPVAQWKFLHAWPSKVTAHSIDPDGTSDAIGAAGDLRSNAFALEELTLTHEFVERQF